jgi:hypothetical protein
MEKKTVLFSLQKGFWNASCGWVAHLCQADKIPVKTLMQINFKNTRDVSRIPLSAIQNVSAQLLQEKLGTTIDIDLSDKMLLPEELIEISRKTKSALGITLWHAEDDEYYMIKLEDACHAAKAPIQAPHFTPCQRHRMQEKERLKQQRWATKSHKKNAAGNT